MDKNAAKAKSEWEYTKDDYKKDIHVLIDSIDDSWILRQLKTLILNIM